MREVRVTKDGSHTIAIPEKSVMYHSVHGAVLESQHVFIEAGLAPLASHIKKVPITIFEMGFGSGLNAFLTALFALAHQQPIAYTTIEALPISEEEVTVLNYPDLLGHAELFGQLHRSPWSKDLVLHQFFTLRKEETELAHFNSPQQFDLIYYDAFAPSAQPELWTKEIFEKLFAMLKTTGALVTYCAKGDVKRAMLAAGFNVKKLPGPPGKREMLRAEKRDYSSKA